MNNPTIDGVSPCECGSADVSIGYESPQGYWVECGDCGYQTDKSHLRDIVIAWWNKRAAPVVERQADAWLDEESGALATADLKGFMVGVAGFEIPLFRAPPQLAELQANIASANADKEAYGQNAICLRKRVDELRAAVERQAAEIAELKAGVKLPDRMEIPDDAPEPRSIAYDVAAGWNACLDATAALNKP